MKKCDICQGEYQEQLFTTFRLRLGEPIGFRIGIDYIEPIDLNIYDWCKKGREIDIINKFKSLLSA